MSRFCLLGSPFLLHWFLVTAIRGHQLLPLEVPNESDAFRVGFDPPPHADDVSLRG